MFRKLRLRQKNGFLIKKTCTEKRTFTFSAPVLGAVSFQAGARLQRALQRFLNGWELKVIFKPQNEL